MPRYGMKLWAASVLRPLAATAIVALLSSVACGHPGGDPGNARLVELAKDPLFAAIPPDSTVDVQLVPAMWRNGGAFEPSAWDGPYVTETIHTNLKDAALFAYYGSRAASFGWQPQGPSPYRWTKRFRRGWTATLSLFKLGPDEASTDAVASFRLVASAPPIEVSGRH